MYVINIVEQIDFKRLLKALAIYKINCLKKGG